MTKPCGARTRSGGACKNQSMENGRCRKHGGLSTGPRNAAGNKNALKHGIYSAGLRDDEHDLWDDLELGSIDNELKLCRIRLRRALIVQQKIEADPNNPEHLDGFEVSEITRTTGTPPSNGKPGRQPGLEVISKRPDLNAIIDRLVGRIESLERTRLELLKDADDDAPESIMIRIKRASKDGT